MKVFERVVTNPSESSDLTSKIKHTFVDSEGIMTTKEVTRTTVTRKTNNKNEGPEQA
jgi:hypothetical protein